MSIKITMPSTEEGKYAVAKTYYGNSISDAALKAYIAKAGKMEAILEEINYALNRAEERISRSDPARVGTSNPTLVAEYEDWSKNLQNYINQFVTEDTAQYFKTDSSGQSVLQSAGVTSDYIEKTDLQKMEAGEMQPNLDTFKEAYGSDQSQGSKALTSYQSALAAWRESSGKTDSGTTSGTTTDGTAADTTTDTASGTTTTDTTTDINASRQSAIDELTQAYNDGLITFDSYLLYTDAVNNWESGTEVNFDTILETFNELKASTIDPYYADQLDRATAYIQSSKDYMTAQRALALESESATAKANLNSAKASLEAAGMTFTGKAREYLGAESAYAQEGKGTSPVEGLNFNDYFEGLVPQEARLVSESSLSSYNKSLADLAASAEEQLGTAGTSALGLATTGDTTGTIQQASESAQASALSQLYSNAIGNEQQGWETNLLS